MTDPRPKQLSDFDESGVSVATGMIVTAGIPAFVAATFSNVIGGRLTIDNIDFSAVPNTELFNKINLYYVPYAGINISLYDGSQWIPHDFFPYVQADISNLSVDTSYDVYIYFDVGGLSFEFVPWTTVGLGADVRTVSVVQVDGIWTKAGEPDRRYVGMIRTANTTTVELEDSKSSLFVWNAYNRVERTIVNQISSDVVLAGAGSGDFSVATGDSALDPMFIIGLSTKINAYMLGGFFSSGGGDGRSTWPTSKINITGISSTNTEQASNLLAPYADNYRPLVSRREHYPSPNRYKAVVDYQLDANGGTFMGGGTFSIPGIALTVNG